MFHLLFHSLSLSFHSHIVFIYYLYVIVLSHSSGWVWLFVVSLATSFLPSFLFPSTLLVALTFLLTNKFNQLLLPILLSLLAPDRDEEMSGWIVEFRLKIDTEESISLLLFSSSDQMRIMAGITQWIRLLSSPFALQAHLERTRNYNHQFPILNLILSLWINN